MSFLPRLLHTFQPPPDRRQIPFPDDSLSRRRRRRRCVLGAACARPRAAGGGLAAPWLDSAISVFRQDWHDKTQRMKARFRLRIVARISNANKLGNPRETTIGILFYPVYPVKISIA